MTTPLPISYSEVLRVRIRSIATFEDIFPYAELRLAEWAISIPVVNATGDLQT